MRWPWQRNREERTAGYAESIIRSLFESASGIVSVTPAATAALEASASTVARCFAGATVEAPAPFQRALSPACLAMISRAMIRTGEIVMAIEFRGGEVSLAPATSWDVRGPHEPERWIYRVTMTGPETVTHRDHVPASGVVHVQYMRNPDRPWLGYGPLQSASIAGRLSAEVANALADESSGPRGALLPAPVDGADPTIANLKADIKTLAGKVAVVEAQGAAGWGDAGDTRGGPGWKPERIGANPPQSLVSLAELAAREVFAACGVPYSLVTDSDGTGQRESYRRLMHSTIVPLARIVEAELSRKLETDIRLNFDQLFAADLAGRARAFQSLVGGGMDIGKAASLAGLMADE